MPAPIIIQNKEILCNSDTPFLQARLGSLETLVASTEFLRRWRSKLCFGGFRNCLKLVFKVIRCLRPSLASRRKEMKLPIIQICLALATGTLFGTTLTDTQGRSIEVEILEVRTDSVEVRRADGYKFNIPFSSLNEASTNLLLEKRKGSEAQEVDFDFTSLNEILGLKLWKDPDLWDDPANKVARRLGWPQESKTTTQSSYRIYFGKEKKPIAGARPHTAVLYGKEGKVDYISIMFANKGDSVGQEDVTDIDEAFDRVNEAIETDEEALRASFETLGEPEREVGGSRDMKERALRWDADNTAFWLAAVEDEYIALRIMPPELADNWGRVENRSDATVRNAAKANVVENELGDVLITNIPMVNQGPKGYCVPATMERCLRYMGIRADMYTLAMAGRTIIGGGTYVGDLIEGTSSYVRRSSRKMREFSGDLSIRKVRGYIDDGQPVIWSMSSTKAYNNLANTITKARRGQADPKEWRSTLNEILRDAPDLQVLSGYGHVCLIVGYNDITDEIAVSDSWGPSYELRWISEDEAAKVSNGKFYVVDF